MCRPVLRGEQTLALRRDLKVVTARPAKRGSADIAEEDLPLWHALRKCRKDLADEQGVPPYVIFHDATLKDMLLRRPLTDVELLAVTGVGDRKLQAFGDAFLDVIRDFEYADPA